MSFLKLKQALYVALLACMMASAAAAESNAPPPAGTVMVRIGNATLTEGELSRMASNQVAKLYPRLTQAEGEPFRRSFRLSEARQFIRETVLLDEADRRQIQVTDVELKKELDAIIKRLPPGMTFERLLEIERCSREVFAERLRNQLRIRKLLQEVENAPISDAEVKEAYERRKAEFEDPERVTFRQIAVNVKPQGDEAARAAAKARIEGLRQQLLEGADFVKLAEAHSDSPKFVTETISRGQVMPVVEEAVFSQKPKAIGPVLDLSFAYTVIQVVKRSPGRTVPINQVKPQLLQMMTREKVKAFEEKLIAQAGVVMDPGLQAAMDAGKESRRVVVEEE